MKTIKTFLPIFPGFYNTIFEPTMAYDDKLPYLSEDCYEVVFDEETACEAMVGCVEKALHNFGVKVKLVYEEVVSPKEYNFRNDSVIIEIHYQIEDLKVIKRTLIDNWPAFENYIRDNYTSCDGFISSHTTDAYEWLESFETDEHRFGAVLNFILLCVAGYGEYDLLEDVLENLYEYETILPEVEALLDQVKSNIRDNYLKGREAALKSVYESFGESGYEFTCDINNFEALLNEVFHDIDNKTPQLF